MPKNAPNTPNTPNTPDTPGRPRKLRVAFKLDGSFRLACRKLSFASPPHAPPSSPRHMPALRLTPPAPAPPLHDTHSAQLAFAELCLRTD